MPDRAALARGAGAAYGLNLRGMRFAPVGYAAACDEADCAPDGRRFPKLWPDTTARREAGARQVRVLPLLRALQGRAAFPWVPAPVPTREGGLSMSYVGCCVVPFRSVGRGGYKYIRRR